MSNFVQVRNVLTQFFCDEETSFHAVVDVSGAK